MNLMRKINRLIDQLSTDRPNPDTILNNKQRDRRHQYIMACATLILVITVQVFVLSMVTLNSIEDAQQNTARAINRINDNRFNNIWGFITQAHLAAQIQSSAVRDNLLDIILDKYDSPDKMEYLKDELENPKDTTDIARIFAAAISDKYMYYDTNYNGMYIIVTYSIDNQQTAPMGYIAATKNSAAGGMDNRQYDALRLASAIKSYANSNLALEYMLNIIYGYADNSIPFLQADDRGALPVMIKGMTKQELYNAYLEAGTDIFDNLVVSAAAYIYNRSDIFGVPDMTSTGNIINNHKIVIVQRFRVSDMLNKYHSAYMREYDLQIQNLLTEVNNSIRYKQLILCVLIVFWVICVIVTVAVQNSLARKLELDYLKYRVVGNNELKPKGL